AIPADLVSVDPALGASVLTTLRDQLAARRAALAPPAKLRVLVSADPDVPYGVVAPAVLAARAADVEIHYGLGGAAPAVAPDVAPSKAWDRPRSPTTITDSRPFVMTLAVGAGGAIDFEATKPLPYGFSGKPGARVDALSGPRLDLDRVAVALETIKRIYADETTVTIVAQYATPWKLVFPLTAAVRAAADGAPYFPNVRLGPAR
ncbi:MAG TPA: hypothetical protein VG389_29730, partial [Myxococcota bacterium]|nr:hypothetical protein [Myxococcota bacterium]